MQKALLELAEVTKGKKEVKPEPCKGCEIYCSCHKPLVFYKEDIEKSVKIMIISRDPNVGADANMEHQVNNLEQIFSTKDITTLQVSVTTAWGRWNSNVERSLPVFIWMLLENINPVERKEFSNWFKRNNNVKNTSKIYWTHIVKCYTHNNKKTVDKVSKMCSNYLSMEIDTIKPKLIIALGNEVSGVLRKITKNKTGFVQTGIKDNKYGNIIILPHPSGSNRLYEYNYEDFSVKEKKTGKIYKLQPLIEYIKKLISN